jgi:glucose-1-phosphate thymidylyltransferase
MLAGIREILDTSTPHDLPRIKDLLGDGSQLGLRFAYVEQATPAGIAQAFLIGEQFVGASPVALILGDNLFFGHNRGASVFAYRVQDPERYGVVEFDIAGRALSLETESPTLRLSRGRPMLVRPPGRRAASWILPTSIAPT